MTALRGRDLLSLPVRLHGIELGRAVELLLDVDELKALGLDVLCGDEVHRFLPLPTARVGDRELLISSPLVLLEEDELAFYRSRAVTLGSLRGRVVEQDARRRGVLTDVRVRADGVLTDVYVADGGVERPLRLDGTIRIAPKRRSAA